ncbi:hypothetical protein AB0M22_19995 [Nocardia sp. NPDC051756]|uniref:hypothetical protein n=1 Tax=Nocardia sp. NPDC051756 TaxID=3154751 RepID=UPI00343C0BA6
MLRGKRMAVAGPDVQLVSLARYVPPRLLGAVLRLGGAYAFPGRYENFGKRVRAAVDKGGNMIGGKAHADRPKGW